MGFFRDFVRLELWVNVPVAIFFGTVDCNGVVPKSYRPEGQPSSPRTENPSRAFVGIVSSIPIWRSISLTKYLN